MSVQTDVRDELLATILKTAPVGILVIEAETLRILLANEQTMATLDPEWRDRDLTGHTFLEVFAAIPTARFHTVIHEVARTGTPVHVRDYAYDGFARGRTYWNYDLTPLHDAAGQLYAVMLSAIETTAHVRAQQRLEETNAALSAINALALRVNATKDLPTIFQYALDTLIALLHLDQGAVGQVDYQEGALRLVVDHSPHAFRHDLRVALDERGTLRWMNEKKTPLAIADTATDTRLPEAERAILVAGGVQSALFVPLIVNGILYGTIGLDATTAPRSFTADEIALAETVSNQLAVAIGNAQLHEQMRQRMTELAALAEMGATVAASLDFDEVVNRVLTAIATLIPHDRAFLMLDDTPETLRVVAADAGPARGGPTRGEIIPKNESLNGWVLEHRQPLCVADLRDARQTVRYFVPPTRDPQLRAVMCVPLIARDQAIGTIYLARYVPDAYTDADLARLSILATQAAAAIANALLYSQSQQHVGQLQQLNDELETMYEIGMAVSASLDPAVVLPRVLTEIRQIIPADSGYVTLLEPDGETLRIVGDFGFDLPRTGERMPVGQSINGQIIKARRTFRIGDVWADPAWQVGWHAAPPTIAPRMRNLLGTPLIVADAVIGTLYLVHRQPDVFTERDAARLEQYAAQTAIAVANARLYEQIQSQVAELRRLNGDLATANQHKSEFLATMSHELRTPLNAIIGFSELLADDIVIADEERRECLSDIHSSARHLLSLINDVLDVAKIESGKMEMRLAAFAVADELREAERVMAPLVLTNRQTLSVAVTPGTPPVYADRARFRQIVLNVLSNANKFTPEGGSITVAAAGDDAGVRIRVTDTGIGIRPEDAPKVFEAFRQIDGSLSRRYNGTGLGLALTRRLVELQGGTIDFESAPGVGTTFTIMLPSARKESEDGTDS